MITCYAARGYLYTEPSRTSWKVRFKINESHANSVIIKSYKNLSHKKECIGGPKASSPHKRKKEIQRTKKQIGKCWQNFKKYTNERLNTWSVKCYHWNDNFTDWSHCKFTEREILSQRYRKSSPTNFWLTIITFHVHRSSCISQFFHPKS